jgi:septal ring factor EnvC (AmiA/AmiB activator)
MRKLLISAALLSAVAVAAPASAQRWDDRGRGYGQNQTQGFDQQLQQLRQRIDQMYQRRLLSNNEARKLQGRVNDLRSRLYDYSRNGLTYRERDDIQRRIYDLRQRIQSERHEGREQRRDDRRDRW